MSDDESFVVLGSSLLPSLENRSASGDSRLPFDELIESTFLPREENSTITLPNGSNLGVNSIANPDYSIPNHVNTSIPSNIETTSLPKVASNGSLAASFIMGEVNADVLKTSIFSQFPSICSMEACAEDVVKLQNFMSQYLELKNTLIKVNALMRQFHDNSQKWKEDITNNFQTKVTDLQTQIAKLRNENLNLERKVADQEEQIKLCDNIRQNDQNEMTKNISEKSAQINNMRQQIEKLEQQQLASFEYLPKSANDSKDKPDYVDRLEHERIVKKFEMQISEMLAENLEMKDMQKQYIDEITCLKVSLTASEEIVKQLRCDINILKANDVEKSKAFLQYEFEREKAKNEMYLLKQQVEVYSKDFELERNARQNMAGEKEQLLQDLRALQRKNQQLIENAQKQLETQSSRRDVKAVHSENSTIGVGKEEASNDEELLYCPVCGKSCKSINILSNHVELCLDNTK